MEEHTLRYGGYIFVVYFWILAAALVSGVLIMLTHTSQVLNNIYYTSKSLSLLLYTQASLSKPARLIQEEKKKVVFWCRSQDAVGLKIGSDVPGKKAPLRP